MLNLFYSDFVVGETQRCGNENAPLKRMVIARLKNWKIWKWQNTDRQNTKSLKCGKFVGYSMDNFCTIRRQATYLRHAAARPLSPQILQTRNRHFGCHISTHTFPVASSRLRARVSSETTLHSASNSIHVHRQTVTDCPRAFSRLDFSLSKSLLRTSPPPTGQLTV